MQIPAALEREWGRDRAWLAELPQHVQECAEQWELDLEEPFATPRSLVVPAGERVLKLNAPSHVETDHEAVALECWAGNGAVRLLARDDGRRAFLMENVLAAKREPFLVLDPKPALGEREVTAVGLLRNAAWQGGAPEVRRWLSVLGELGLDAERARGWGIANALAWGHDREGRWSSRAVEAARTIAAA